MDPLQHQQLDIAARLMADPYFAPFFIAVLRPRKDASALQIAESINNSLAGIAQGNGIAIEVMMPLLDRVDEGSGILLFEPKVTVRVKENPAYNMGTNGTKIPAEEIVLMVCSRLEGFLAQGYGGSAYIPKDAVTPVLRTEFAGLVVYDVNVKGKFGLQNPLKVALPQITGDHTAVTIATPTEGAAIYYTTDESYPWAGNVSNPSTAVLYTTPFTATAGAKVRACAFLDTYQQSDVALETIN